MLKSLEHIVLGYKPQTDEAKRHKCYCLTPACFARIWDWIPAPGTVHGQGYGYQQCARYTRGANIGAGEKVTK